MREMYNETQFHDHTWILSDCTALLTVQNSPSDQMTRIGSVITKAISFQVTGDL